MESGQGGATRGARLGSNVTNGRVGRFAWSDGAPGGRGVCRLVRGARPLGRERGAGTRRGGAGQVLTAAHVRWTAGAIMGVGQYGEAQCRAGGV